MPLIPYSFFSYSGTGEVHLITKTWITQAQISHLPNTQPSVIKQHDHATCTNWPDRNGTVDIRSRVMVQIDCVSVIYVFLLSQVVSRNLSKSIIWCWWKNWVVALTEPYLWSLWVTLQDIQDIRPCIRRYWNLETYNLTEKAVPELQEVLGGSWRISDNRQRVWRDAWGEYGELHQGESRWHNSQKVA